MKNVLEDIKSFSLLALLIIVFFSVISLLLYLLFRFFFHKPDIGLILSTAIPLSILLLFALGNIVEKCKFGYYSNRNRNYRKIKGPIKNIKFTAKYVTYNQVLDGDVIQILFEEDTTNSIRYDPKKDLKILINHEHSPTKLSFMWYDGKEDKRSNRKIDIKINRSNLKLYLENNIFIQVAFNIDSDLYSKIESCLKEFS